MEIAGWMTVASMVIVTLTTVGAFTFNGINIRKMRVSIEITRDKERTTGSLDIMDRFVKRGVAESVAESITYLSAKSPDFYNNGSPEGTIIETKEINWRMNSILSFFNLLAYLLEKNRIDYDIIKDNLGFDLVSFAWKFQVQIGHLITFDKKINLKRNYGSYFDLCIRLVEDLNLNDDDKDFIDGLKKGFE